MLNGMEILLRMLTNILKSPQEPKFRTVKGTIPKIQAALFSLAGDIGGFLTTIGFIEIEPSVYSFVEDDLSLVNKASLLVDEALDPVRIKFMPPEEAEKHKLLMARKA